jgi:hypothetical protein
MSEQLPEIILDGTYLKLNWRPFLGPPVIFLEIFYCFLKKAENICFLGGMTIPGFYPVPEG